MLLLAVTIMAHNQYKFVSHCSREWKVLDFVPGFQNQYDSEDSKLELCD